MSKISDKTKLFIAVGLLEGLKTDLENRLIKTTDKFRYQFIIDITGDKSELNKLPYLYLEVPPSPAVIRKYNEIFIFIDEFTGYDIQEDLKNFGIKEPVSIKNEDIILKV